MIYDFFCLFFFIGVLLTTIIRDQYITMEYFLCMFQDQIWDRLYIRLLC